MSSSSASTDSSSTEESSPSTTGGQSLTAHTPQKTVESENTADAESRATDSPVESISDHGQDEVGKRLNASAGVITGIQADRYEIGDMVFVNHEAVAWPARIEDPSCVQEMVTRHQYAVFLYGIHERLVVKLKNIFLYDENRKSFGKKTCHRILNMALIESRTDPDVNIRRIPYHKRKPCQYLRKSRSHTLLDRYMDANKPPNPTNPDLSIASSDEKFYNRGILSYDRSLGYFAIIFSFIFMMYMTWWIVLLPFLDPTYHAVIKDLFPRPGHGLAYPIAGGTIVACSVMAFYGAVMYGPRCDGYQWMVITPHADSNLLLANRQQKVKELREVIKRRQPALFLTLILVALFLTPFRVIALVVIVFGLYYLVNDLLYHM